MAAEATEGGLGEPSARLPAYPRDLLRRFGVSSCRDEVPNEAGGESRGLELSLGLSLGGCFGVDPGEKKLLVRSSTLSMFPTDEVIRPIAKTCSLPTENEEEHRKRREMQSLKRLEAKRRRLERKDWRFGVKDQEENSGEQTNGPQVKPELNDFPGFMRVAAGLGPVSQGSVGSQGSCSSAVSDPESRPAQGIDISGLSSCTIPLLHRTDHKATTPLALVVGKPIKASSEEDNMPKKAKVEMERNVMEEMPCVSTRGDGPNGRRIEGFLYKYGKGEDVRIVCVCHGSFLTPAEFVKHAGGGDVAYPLRHIVVNPASSSFS